MATYRMSNADAAWLHMDRPTNLMVVNAVLWFDEPVDLERATQVIRTRLVERFPRFARRVVEPRAGLGVPSWEDDPDFDLSRHVHHVALPAPGDRGALQEMVGDLMGQPLDRSKPLWDMYLVDGYGGGSAVISRMHHCIADGIALARVLLSLTDEQPDPASIAPGESAPAHGGVVGAARAGVHAAQLATHEGIELLEHPRAEVGGLVSGALADARALGKLLLTRPDRRTVLRGELGTVQRVAWSDRIPLSRVKRIGHATRTTVNDVVVAAMTGALRDHLVDRGTPVDEIRAMVPFNLRPLDQPLPRELGNRFGLVYLTLPVGIEDPHERLMEVHRRMAAIKDSPEGAVSYAILGLIGQTPPPVEQRLIDLFAPKTTAVMTNVPGPAAPVWFAGAKVAGVLGWVPAAGAISTGVSIFSYAGGITVGLRVNARLVPDPGTIVRSFQREVRVMERRGGGGAPRPPPPRRPPRGGRPDPARPRSARLGQARAPPATRSTTTS